VSLFAALWRAVRGRPRQRHRHRSIAPNAEERVRPFLCRIVARVDPREVTAVQETVTISREMCRG
jgi:hypothetical protein